MKFEGQTIPRQVEQRIRKRARLGARALDRIAPDWFTRKAIKLTKLQLMSGCNCVYGQLESAVSNERIDVCHIDRANEVLSQLNVDARITDGNYDEYRSEALNIIDEMETSDLGYTYDHDDYKDLRDAGFDYDAPAAAFSVLQDEWEGQIRRRRAKAAA